MCKTIEDASLDRIHLRDETFPATGTQGYREKSCFPRLMTDCIAQMPPVKAKPLARWLLYRKTDVLWLGESWDI